LRVGSRPIPAIASCRRAVSRPVPVSYERRALWLRLALSLLGWLLCEGRRRWDTRRRMQGLLLLGPILI
jgi:hypothetical protein